MTVNGMLTSIAGAMVQRRVSPISRVGFFLTVAMAAAAVVISVATVLVFLNLPNILPLVLGVLVLDGISRLAPQTLNIQAVQTTLYGILYLVITCFSGVLAAYAMQRFAFPLQDRLFTRVDAALGVNWFAIAHWVDGHLEIQRALKFAYASMGAQIAIPVVVLAFANRLSDLRIYLLAFTLALVVTTIIGALLPAASPIVLVDRTTFNVLRFSGATPIEHLARLRAAAPIVLSGSLGGVIAFPSFHAAVATLTPLVLYRYRGLFVALLLLDAAMLGGCVTEGAHYLSDVLAGIGIVFFAYFLAKHIIDLEDRLPPHHFYRSIAPLRAEWAGRDPIFTRVENPPK
jgi:PAP2 superfamily